MSENKTKTVAFKDIEIGDNPANITVWYGGNMDIGDGRLSYGCSIKAPCERSKKNMDRCSELLIAYGLGMLDRVADQLEKKLREVDAIED